MLTALEIALGVRSLAARVTPVMKTQGKPLGIRILTIPVAIGVVALWVYFFRFQPDDPRDFSGDRRLGFRQGVHFPQLWTP